MVVVNDDRVRYCREEQAGNTTALYFDQEHCLVVRGSLLTVSLKLAGEQRLLFGAGSRRRSAR